MVEHVERKAAVSLITRGDRLLCVWNRRYGGWSLPGGMVEEGETPRQAQERELKEETGLDTVRAVLVHQGPHGIVAKEGAARPGRASIVCLFRVEAAGIPEELEPGSPIDWKTVDDFLAGSPFREFYERVLPALVSSSD